MLKFLFWTILSIILGVILLYLSGLTVAESGGFGSYLVSAAVLGTTVHLIINGLGVHPTKIIARTLLPKEVYDAKFSNSGNVTRQMLRIS